jgi:hypothetical protein
VATKLSSMARRGSIATGEGNGRRGRESREDVVVGVAERELGLHLVPK